MQEQLTMSSKTFNQYLTKFTTKYRQISHMLTHKGTNVYPTCVHLFHNTPGITLMLYKHL